mmetsp:Transcript_42339/g.70133  ORF Transcript_42339/g.70133 Transcript_42339/m.70133 type:complete len:228 (+) Transcript_42339:766-1449(+)
MRWQSLVYGHDLLQCLICHRRVAFHDPTRDLKVIWSRRVLQVHPALFYGLCCSKLHCCIVIHLSDCAFTAMVNNMLDSSCCTSLRHVDDCLLTQLLCCPGHRPPMVAIRASHERSRHVACKGRVALLQALDATAIADWHVQLLGHPARHCESTPEDFERLLPQALRLILDVDASQSPFLGRCAQRHQRRCRRSEEAPDLRRRLGAEAFGIDFSHAPKSLRWTFEPKP